jgi:hypothetical protein
MEEETEKMNKCSKSGAFVRQSNLPSPVHTALANPTTCQLTEINSETHLSVPSYVMS